MSEEIKVINNADAQINFFEFASEIDKKYLQAMKVFANVQDANGEKSRQEWIDLYREMFNKVTK